MSVTDSIQQDVIAFLKQDLTTTDGPPKIITTHISVIFLSGERAFKLKRAVAYSFLDFTSLEARHIACERELEINRRTAPTIYKGVVPVTRVDGQFSMGGDGEVVDWLVEMARFDEATLFDRLVKVERGLRRPMIEGLADAIADFHRKAEISKTRGGADGIRKIAENNVVAFSALPDDIFTASDVNAVTSETLARIDAQQSVLDDRRGRGCVRHCHGDLHLRNICLVDGKPTLFDAIEFSDDFSEIDVAYDLAFVLMDLQFHGQRRLASFLLNRYLEVADEQADLYRVLPIFLSMRAQIRAHVGAAISAAQTDKDARDRELQTARNYLDLAKEYLNETPPRLVAVGGLSGSGKSRLAREVASYIGLAPGARVVRTDVVRKRISGIHPNETLGAEGYTAEMTIKTYDAFFDQARQAILAGQSVVLDAVFAMRDQRETAEALASELNVSFTGVWVAAPEEVRIERVMKRERNVSDITPEIARSQSSYDVGDMTWASVNSAGEKTETVSQGLRILGV